jgi:hypothetical protein
MKNGYKLLIVGILCFMAIVGFASAASVPGQPLAGTDAKLFTCDKVMGVEYGQYKFDPVRPVDDPIPYGTYNDPFNVLTIVVPSILSPSYNSIDFTSPSYKVMGVIVKDGIDGAFFYDYRPGGTNGDTYLTTPDQCPPKNNCPKGISHVNFCFTTGPYVPPPVPEFPTVALPVGMLIGLVGLVYFVRIRE